MAVLRSKAGDSAGTVYTLGEMGKGQVFGELALLRREPSRVTVTTTMDSDLLAIDSCHDFEYDEQC